MSECVVILWSFGYHCDEFEIEKVIGPVSSEKAEELRLEYMDTHEFHTVVMELTKGE